MSITNIDAQASAQPADALDRADMERLAAGQDTALNDLMERHATPVFHFLCRMVGNEDDANDLAQETFVRVFRARASFRTSEKFSTWLFTIAANLARNHFRWRSRHPNVSLETETGESEQTLGSTLSAGEPVPNEQALVTERRSGARRSRQTARGFARSGCAVRMGGT
jgi:RNA polymerase sigma-70 factor (ECF subfamily)